MMLDTYHAMPNALQALLIFFSVFATAGALLMLYAVHRTLKNYIRYRNKYWRDYA